MYRYLAKDAARVALRTTREFLEGGAAGLREEGCFRDV